MLPTLFYIALPILILILDYLGEAIFSSILIAGSSLSVIGYTFVGLTSACSSVRL